MAAEVGTLTDIQDLGILKGHNGWVTSIVTGHSQAENEESDLLITGGRDNTILVWSLGGAANEEGVYGVPYKSMTGHSHFISDMSLSNDNCFLISSSWDKTMRLWDLRSFRTARLFQGHDKEILSCSFSPDNRQIISAGADKGIRLWNTRGENKFTSEESNHQDWVSCVRYSPMLKNNSAYFCSVGWDGRIKIWNTNFQIRCSFKHHDENVNSLSISPNGKYIATAGAGKVVRIWDVTSMNEFTREFDLDGQVTQLAFNPKRQWIAAAYNEGIKVWDLMSNSKTPIAVMRAEKKVVGKHASKNLACTSISWSSQGTILYGGFSDGNIRVWKITTKNS